LCRRRNPQEKVAMLCYALVFICTVTNYNKKVQVQVVESCTVAFYGGKNS
jgi:hypothetical protein